MVSPKVDGDEEEPGFSEPLEGISYIFVIFRNCCEFESFPPKCPKGLGLAPSLGSLL